ncbi:DUF2946 domain-containing protein [Caballeronia sp. LZ035]|uniref:DUF2946 domain-containing protein n=1 Tax=Caballeronia sp. LZ035 TaxID=3038568 RepID=UPI002863B86B|nr:DUF2946 domain-containing protein [Caballeronia sp. LZ035]MDR5757045.1 DUF2946 domain-containing protein [Caballeronia sp. LZ035]
MTRNARNRFVAWLGIAAMWLAIVAPVISQTLAARAAADDPQAALCAVAPSAEGAHAASASHDAAGHVDACAYCGLLAHHLPVAPGITPQAARIERVARMAPRAPVASIHSKSFNAARSRAPPVYS